MEQARSPRLGLDALRFCCVMYVLFWCKTCVYTAWQHILVDRSSDLWPLLSLTGTVGAPHLSGDVHNLGLSVVLCGVVWYVS